jgi:hypothetical protein
VGGSFHKYPVATKSEMDVRHEGNEFVLATDLIAHHGIANVFNQTAKCILILNVVEETPNIPLLYQWPKFSENIFQFPDSPCLSDLSLNCRECGLTVPVSFSVLAP